jgi:amino acid transporter
LTIDATLTTPPSGHELKRELRLRDLVQMQILLVVGVTWIGIAAKQGGVHLVFWIAAILTLFLPSAAVVTYCVQIWPEEGGVYQWTTHAFGPLAGFLNAWNFGLWALITVSNIGIMFATSLAYSLGDRYAWIANSNKLINTFNITLFAIILVLCVVGFRILKWVAHFGTFCMVAVNILLVGLLFFHPHATRLHPHHAPQAPFSLALTMPMLTLLSLNLFSKMALNGLTGLEQIAVFAGETKDAARAIWKSAWIAAPMIALIFILGTGALLTYIPANQIDLTGPVPQVLAAAFGGGPATAGINWGLMLGRGAILALAISVIAQYALIISETSRLPMVAGWDGILPEWFSRLSPRFGTPVRSIVLIVSVSVAACILATQFSSGAQEAFQLITVEAAFLYDIYFAMMFLIPLTVGSRFGKPAGVGLKIAAATGLLVTVIHAVFSMYPIIDIKNPIAFAEKIGFAAVAVNLAGGALYWQARRATRSRLAVVEERRDQPADPEFFL